jgi:pimeloyl-ACP methyl ester carboxylesterase
MAGPVRLSVLDYGGPGPDGAAVLLHGMADVALGMDSLAQALADRFHVLAPDLRGHGRSDQPGAYSHLHFVADLVGLADARGLERFVLVGHSLGGHTAAWFASLYPERVRLLVLIEGMGPPARPAGSTSEGRARLARAHLELLGSPLHHKPLADVDAAAARLLAVHPRLSPDRARRLAEDGTRPGPDGGVVWRFDPRTRDWVTSIDHVATEERWAALACPTLVVTGGESWEEWWAHRLSPVAVAEGRERLTPAEHAARLATIADHEHHEVPDAGHLVQFDQPERLNEIVTGFVARRLA